MQSSEILLKAVEDGLLSWEQLARELIAENSEDDNAEVVHTFELDDEDEYEVD
jgi:hypothetical protein